MSTPFENIPVKERKIAVSGGFDPLHIGHIRMFEEAAKFGPLYVILNSDEFLKEKKGRVFMAFKERKEIIEALGCVHAVVESIDVDHTVCSTLRQLAPDAFINGGDRFHSNIPERSVCDKLGIAMIFGVGGVKIRSSSELLQNYENQEDSVGVVDKTGEFPLHVAEDSSSEGSNELSSSSTS